ncbi:hypothetical protein EV426DRAFT_669202 [Tirmania nivea]|nr:hypothetical protein EV426DRAFT_669202 [Tirmania nivea]
MAPPEAKSTPLFGEEAWMRLMGRKRAPGEYKAEEAHEQEIPVEEVLVEEAFEEDEEAEEVKETTQAREPWVVRGETWLQAVKLEKQRRWHLPPSRPVTPSPAPQRAPTPAPSLVFQVPLTTSPFADQEDAEPWNSDFFAPVITWSAEDSLPVAAGPTTGDGFQYQFGGYTQDQQGLSVYDPYTAYGSNQISASSAGAIAEAPFSLAFGLTPLVSLEGSSGYSVEWGFAPMAPTPQGVPSEIAYFDEDLFDWALRGAVREAELAAGGVAVQEEVPDPALGSTPTPVTSVSGTIPLSTAPDVTPSPTARTASAPPPALVSQGARSLKRKRVWGKFEEDEHLFVAAQRKLVRRGQQHREFREMREVKVSQMAEIVGGEIAASLAEARVKVEEQKKLVAEQRSLVEEQRRLVEELRAMVKERWRMVDTWRVLPSPVAALVPVRASEETDVEISHAVSPKCKKRRRVADSEMAMEELEVENSRRLVAELINTENWGSGLCSAGEKEVGASTDAPLKVNSVSSVSAPETPSVPTLSLSPQAAVRTAGAGSTGDQEVNSEREELDLLAGLEPLPSSAEREKRWQEQFGRALAEPMQRLEYGEGGRDSTLDADFTHGDHITCTPPPPPPPPPTEALPPPAPPKSQPTLTTPSEPPEIASRRGHRPPVAPPTLPGPPTSVHERRFLRSSGTTWVEEVNRLAATETTRRHAGPELRRRQLSSWNAEVCRGILLGQQLQSGLLADVQRERDRIWAELGRRLGEGRLELPLAELQRENQDEREPERVVSSGRRPAPTFKPAWDWSSWCQDWSDE